MSASDKLIDRFAGLMKSCGVPVRTEENAARLLLFKERLPKRISPSFESLLSKYSFPAFDILGITLFAWDSDPSPCITEAPAAANSLSEVLLPAGYVQIGRPSTGTFDAICFDLNDRAHNHEHRIVQIDHEQILCNRQVRLVRELWPSFVRFVESALSNRDPQVHYNSLDQ